jgi:hypothetical protein
VPGGGEKEEFAYQSTGRKYTPMRRFVNVGLLSNGQQYILLSISTIRSLQPASATAAARMGPPPIVRYRQQ